MLLKEDHLFMPKAPFLNLPSPPLPFPLPLSPPLPSFLSVTSFPVCSLCHSISFRHPLTPFRLCFTKYTTCLFSSLLSFFLCMGLVLFAGPRCFPLGSYIFVSCRSLCHFLLENRTSTRTYFPNSQSSSKYLQGTCCALGTVLGAGRQQRTRQSPCPPGLTLGRRPVLQLTRTSLSRDLPTGPPLSLPTLSLYVF